MSAWQPGDVVANGIKIHYHRTGGAKPTVVLLHGITDNGLCWTRIARALEADYDLIMVDARGHGQSDAPESGYTADHHAADVAGLIQGLGLDRPVVMGHSMGGSTAAAVAANYPQLVRGAVLEDPPWRNEIPTLDPHGAEKWRAGILANREKTIEELIEWCRINCPKWDEAERQPWAESKRQVSLHVAGFAHGLRTPWQDVVRRIVCPTLLVTADPEAGSIVTPEVAEEAKGLCDGLRVIRLRGAGHNIRREQFEGFLAAVSAFLAEVYA